MESQRKSSGEDSPGERGLIHLWKGYSCSLTPDRVLLPRPVLQVALGTSHGVMLVEGGQVYSFGALPWKQVQVSEPLEPVLENTLSGQRVVSVAAGGHHSGAVTEDGGVHMWGENSAGQCGVPGVSLVPNPTPVGVLDPDTCPPHSVRILELACGEQHSLALSAQHEVWAWGSGSQLGLLTTVFPVWKPQRVEHLAGRHVLQVACGAMHSLALVRCLGPQDFRRPFPDKCGQCHQQLYTMTDKEDHVIISDSHYCPLGVELGEGEALLGPGGGSKVLRLRTSPSEPLLSSLSLTSAPPASPAGPSEPSSKDPGLTHPHTGVTDPELVHPLPHPTEPQPPPPCSTSSYPQAPQGMETGDPQPSSGCGAAGAKSSPYPDEQEVKDYLKRLSDQALAEQTAKTLAGASGLQPVPDSSPPEAEPGSQPPSTASSTLNSLVVSCASAVGERVASTYEALSLKKMMNYYYPSVGSGGHGVASVGAGGLGEGGLDRVLLEETMQGKKSSSLGDIREEEAEGLRRRLSLPGLLSQGRYAVQLLSSSYTGLCK